MLKKWQIALALAVFALLFAADGLVAVPAVTEVRALNSAPAAVPKLSEIKGPSIDGEGASVVRLENSATCALSAACATLPAGLWVFLLVAYLALLGFNLAYKFKESRNIRWVWETIMTLLLIAGWFYFDQCRSHLWFPLYVMKLGIIIYLFYLYFFGEKQKNDSGYPESLE